MALPVLPLPTATVEIAGQPVPIKALSRADVVRLTTEFRGRPVEAETFILVQGASVSGEEATSWLNSTGTEEARDLVDKILVLSNVVRQAEEGEEEQPDPKPPTSEPS